jgi:hypothetical protein
MADKTRRIDRGGEAEVIGEAGADHFAADVATASDDRAGGKEPDAGIADPDGGGTGVGDMAGGTGIGTDDAGGDGAGPTGDGTGRT